MATRLKRLRSAQAAQGNSSLNSSSITSNTQKKADLASLVSRTQGGLGATTAATIRASQDPRQLEATRLSNLRGISTEGNINASNKGMTRVGAIDGLSGGKVQSDISNKLTPVGGRTAPVQTDPNIIRKIQSFQNTDTGAANLDSLKSQRDALAQNIGKFGNRNGAKEQLDAINRQISAQLQRVSEQEQGVAQKTMAENIAMQQTRADKNNPALAIDDETIAKETKAAVIEDPTGSQKKYDDLEFQSLTNPETITSEDYSFMKQFAKSTGIDADAMLEPLRQRIMVKKQQLMEEGKQDIELQAKKRELELQDKLQEQKTDTENQIADSQRQVDRQKDAFDEALGNSGGFASSELEEKKIEIQTDLDRNIGRRIEKDKLFKQRSELLLQEATLSDQRNLNAQISKLDDEYTKAQTQLFSKLQDFDLQNKSKLFDAAIKDQNPEADVALSKLYGHAVDTRGKALDLDAAGNPVKFSTGEQKDYEYYTDEDTLRKMYVNKHDHSDWGFVGGGGGGGNYNQTPIAMSYVPDGKGNMLPKSAETTSTDSMVEITEEQAPQLFVKDIEYKGEFFSLAENCVKYAREYVGNLPTGLFTIQDKEDAVSQSGFRDPNQVRAGDAVLTREGTYGHVAIITGVDENGDWTLSEANYHPGKVEVGRPLGKDDKTIIGYVSNSGRMVTPEFPNQSMNPQIGDNQSMDVNQSFEQPTPPEPVLEGPMSSQVGDFNSAENEGWNAAIMDDIEVADKINRGEGKTYTDKEINDFNRYETTDETPASFKSPASKRQYKALYQEWKMSGPQLNSTSSSKLDGIVMNNLGWRKLEDKDAMRGYRMEVSELVKGGLSEDEALLKFKNNIQDSVIDSGIQGPARSAVNMAVIGLSATDADNVRFGVREALANGSQVQLKDTLRIAVAEGLLATPLLQFDGREKLLRQMYGIRNSLDAYAKAGGTTGIFEGTEEKIKEKIGKKYKKGSDLNRIANDISLALFEYRKDMTGAQFGEAEAKAYKGVFPDIGNDFSLNMDKIQSVIDNAKRNQGTILRTKLGVSAQEIFGDEYIWEKDNRAEFTLPPSMGGGATGGNTGGGTPELGNAATDEVGVEKTTFGSTAVGFGKGFAKERLSEGVLIAKGLEKATRPPEEGDTESGFKNTVISFLNNLQSDLLPGSASRKTREFIENITGKDVIGEGLMSKAESLMSAGEGINIKESEKLGKNLELATEIIGVPSAATVRKFMTNAPKMYDNIVKEAFFGAIKPSRGDAKTFARLEQASDNAATTVKNIIDNKSSLKLQTQEGVVTGELPQNVSEFSQAIQQIKSIIFRKIDEFVKKATGQGAEIGTSDISDELVKFANSKEARLTGSDDAINFANKMSDRFKDAKLSPDDTESLIQRYNSELEAFYKNPSPDQVSIAAVKSMIVNRLRKGLDDAVTKIDGPGFQALKKEYGSAKAIEDSVAKKAFAEMSKNTGGIIDLSQIYNASDLLAGAFSGNAFKSSKGALGLLMNSYYKFLKNPNTIIKNMFKDAENAKSGITPTKDIIQSLMKGAGAISAEKTISNQTLNK